MIRPVVALVFDFPYVMAAGVIGIFVVLIVTILIAAWAEKVSLPLAAPKDDRSER